MNAVILAAGFGSRLSAMRTPKPLVEVAGISLLEWSVRQMAAVGVTRAVIVTGHRADEIEARLPGIAQVTGVALEPCRMADWARPNGHSVIAGAARITGNYLLVMADHLLSVGLLQRLVTDFDRSSGAALAIDRGVDGPAIDPADATWVRCHGNGQIAQIGKHLSRYDAVDCGDGMQRLADRGSADTVDATGELWIDVDDPAMLALAQAMAPALLGRGAAQPISHQVAA